MKNQQERQNTEELRVHLKRNKEFTVKRISIILSFKVTCILAKRS